MINRKFALDLLDRALRTYAQTVVGLLSADGFHILHLATDRAAAIAALPAAWSVINSALVGSLKSGGAETAALASGSGPVGSGMADVSWGEGASELTGSDPAPADAAAAAPALEPVVPDAPSAPVAVPAEPAPIPAVSPEVPAAPETGQGA